MNYFLKRLLLFFPSLFLISLLIFSISLFSPIELSSQLEENANKVAQTDFHSLDSKLKSIRNSRGLDQPSFYFSIERKTLSDTLYKISIEDIRMSVKAWSFQLASWEKANTLYAKIKQRIKNEPDQESRLSAFFYERNVDQVLKGLNSLDQQYFDSSFMESMSRESPINNYLPSVSWNGTNNRYHLWISKLLRLDLGRSLITKESVNQKLRNALGWTISLSMISLVISLLIAVPLAVYAAQQPNGWLDRFCSSLFFSLYSLPVFWVATLLLIWFASKENFYWFPSFGVGELNDSMSVGEKLQIRASHLFLPILCWTYGSLAFIYRQMRSKMSEVLQMEYIQTAKAKGLNSSGILWKHAFGNSKFPLITFLGASLPALFTGSFVIESIFSIPGMGKLTIDSFLQRDYPLIFSISMLACFLTILGIFLADLAYHYSDPRLKLSKQND